MCQGVNFQSEAYSDPECQPSSPQSKVRLFRSKHAVRFFSACNEYNTKKEMLFETEADGRNVQKYSMISAQAHGVSSMSMQGTQAMCMTNVIDGCGFEYMAI